LPKLAVDIDAPAPADLTTLFPVPVDNVRLEIGFGGGEHMIGRRRPIRALASSESSRSFTAWPRRWPAIEDKQLANIRLHFGDATFLLAWLPPASLARVDLIYPDPWPKRRHWKRRFRPGPQHRRDRASPAAGRRIPFRQRPSPTTRHGR